MTLPRLTGTRIRQLNNAELGNGFAVLGLHRGGKVATVNAFFPGAGAVWLCDRAGEKLLELTCLDPSGLFSSGRKAPADLDDYRYLVRYDDTERYCEDPYRFASLLEADDAWLFSEGRHRRAWRFLGAHAVTHRGVAGVQFAVWAPNARRVAVVGDFNHYDARTHVMRFHPGCGIWEMFVPGPGVGSRYRFDLIDAGGHRRRKADPYARAMAHPAEDLAVVSESRFTWTDAAWMQGREASDLRRPVSIYEVHAGSWRPGLGYAELAHTLIDYARDLGFTHVEFLPLMEHPFTGSWGYQPVGLFAPSARYGDPDGLRALVNRAHERGMGVILDWVPAHFPGDAQGLARFDGTALYEHEDPRRGRHPDWDTLIFNYDRAEVIDYLVSNALYWVEEFHVDGLRVDAVASMLYLDYSRREGEWLPNRYGGRENLEAIALLQRINDAVRALHPGVLMVAEESTAFPGVTAPTAENGLGFSLKWNMGWMHDTLNYMARDPVHRAHHHNDITFSMTYAHTERFMLPISHDEVVHGKGSLLGKMPGDKWRRLANLRLLLAFMWAHPGKKLLFMGCELGQEAEWNHDGSVDWRLADDGDHEGIRRLVRDLNGSYAGFAALHRADDDPAGFLWLDVDDRQRSILAFQRSGDDGDAPVLCCANMTPVVRDHYRLRVPQPGSYREIVNTDSKYYGGSNLGNQGRLHTVTAGDEHLLEMTLPPLAALYLAREAG